MKYKRNPDEDVLERAHTLMERRVGRGNMISVPDFIRHLDLHDRHSAWSLICILRQIRKLRIVSDRSRYGGGYYLAETDDEVRRGTSLFRRQATVSALNAARISGESLPEIFLDILASLRDEKTELYCEIAKAFGTLDDSEANVATFTSRLFNKLLSAKGEDRQKNIQTLRAVIENADAELVAPGELDEMKRSQARLSKRLDSAIGGIERILEGLKNDRENLGK